MKKLLLLSVLFVATAMSAQDVDVVKGDFSFLKDQKEINVEFDYSKVTILKDKKTEAQYVEDRAKELNDKNKGVGDTWKKKWASAKELIWNPKFLELMNTIFSKEKKDVTFNEGLTSAKYTVIVEVVWIYPGWDAAVMKQPAKVTTNLKVVETKNKSNVLVEVTSENAPGDQWGNNFSNESRVGEGFAKTGKSFAKLLIKKGYK
ncbi:hypothetical protein [Flavobacterium sp. 3HN19-14]|uniref:hypothetical protein n=1 Tax=Flavobacterium sp. 3HN19-14 TaxID=3448133 RepID=UPI003EE0800F